MCQRNLWFYWTFNEHLDEFSLGLSNLQEVVWNLKETKNTLKTYIYVPLRLRVKVQVKILDRILKEGSFITFWPFVNYIVKIISIGSFFRIRFSFIKVNVKILERNSKQSSFITFDSLVTPNLKLSQLEVFSSSGLVLLTLGTRSLFLIFRKKTCNFAVQICCAAVK